MSHKRISRSQQLALTQFCSAPGEEDGVDPKDLCRKNSRRRLSVDRKTLQLCGQVAQIIDAVLNGELGDDDLAGWHVVSVLPAGKRGCLLVSVAPGPVAATCQPELIQQKLKHHLARLRSEVAHGISRRKAPVLTFAVLPEQNFSGDQP